VFMWFAGEAYTALLICEQKTASAGCNAPVKGLFVCFFL